MAHKTLVGGTSYEISGGKTLVDGTAYSISGGKTLVGGTAYEIGFRGKTLGNLAVGNLVYIRVNGTKTAFRVVHQGLPSSLYDGSCNGTWLLMTNIYTKRKWNDGSNDYGNSTIHQYLNDTFLGLFSGNIQAAIKQVKLPYRAGTSGTTVKSGSEGLSAKVFLLSYVESGLGSNTYAPVEGGVLDYFSGGATSTNSKRIAKYNNTATGWWLRSPYTDGSNYSWLVGTDGARARSLTSYSFGVRPALIMPSELGYDANFNVIA